LEESSEIKALLKLIDDPDEQIFMAVSDKLVSYGSGIIPNLEHMWESIHNETTQERIEHLIHRVHFRDLSADFQSWAGIPSSHLLDGVILLTRYHYPDLNVPQLLTDIEKIKKNIWLELNHYLTPVEQVGVFNSILYNYYKLGQKELSYDSPSDFLINKTITTKQGNKYGIGSLYLLLCELLDIPVFAVNIPGQFILSYYQPGSISSELAGEHPLKNNLFFIDPSTGQMFSARDVENYLKSNLPDYPLKHFKPLNNMEVMRILLKEVCKCYDTEQNAYKQEELLQWIKMLDPQI
jgi:regulator of sirC expression with transglutaminase-like and TPR domain